mmetsp:Transcript_36342/g.78658  ORF Transcript_36342/g.78658 Transcript_36342/m.78658 type:complete len:235 (+) Transcript_36342:608-1312(+)
MVTKVVAQRHDAFLAVLPDAVRLGLPTLHPVVGEKSQWAAREHECPNGVRTRRLQNLVLVRLRGVRLLGTDEPCADPDASSTQRQCGSKTTPIVDATGCHHKDIASEVVLLALAYIRNLRNQNHGADVASVASAFSALSDENVHASLQGLLCVPHRTHHVGDRHTASVKLLHCPRWRDAHSTDEQPRLLCDDDVDEFRKVPMSVIVIGLPGIATNLRDRKVHPEREGFVLQAIF